MGLLRTIFPLLISLNLQAGLYDIKDLEVLESNKSYKEFLDHATDVRPSQRGKHWSEMVGNMAVGFIKSKITQKAFDKENFDYIEKLRRIPALASNDYFLHKRKDFGLSYLETCHASTCKKDILSFWYSSKRKDGETAKKLALNLRQVDPNASLIPFLKIIGHDDYALYHCKKPWVQQEIFSIVTEPLRMEKFDKVKSTLNLIAGVECWKSLRPVIHQALIQGPGLKQDYAFSLLKTRNDLTQEWEDFYYISYFLGSPTPGNTFNQSWNRMKILGQNYSRRIKVLRKLKTIDPLPGRLFSLVDSGKKNTLMKYFKKHFPEYITHYSKTCISYLSGKVSFDNGNPTPDCDNLFAENYVEDRIKRKYSALKK